MTVRMRLNRAGIRALLRSDEIADDLERRGRQIAAAAGPGHEVERWAGRNRARITVRTATADARADEAEHRTLSRAFDAGRR